MMGTKERSFALLPPVSLEELVPPDHFYRHLERTLDLGFLRDLVRDADADAGRPSIDPVVFFKLQLVMVFEGIRSERQLIEIASLNLAHCWYLGYALDETLPDHSNLTRSANTPAPWVADTCTLSASQSTTLRPLHQGDRTPIPHNQRT